MEGARASNAGGGSSSSDATRLTRGTSDHWPVTGRARRGRDEKTRLTGSGLGLGRLSCQKCQFWWIVDSLSPLIRPGEPKTPETADLPRVGKTGRGSPSFGTTMVPPSPPASKAALRKTGNCNYDAGQDSNGPRTRR